MDIPRKTSKRWRTIRRVIYVVVGLAAVGGITYGLSKLKPAAPSVDRRTVWTDTVVRGSMLRQVGGVGKLVSEDILWVPSEVKGRVSRILVEPGTEVQVYTVIMELTNPELELELLDAESKLNSAQARLDAREASLQTQLLEMESTLAQMDANLKEAELRAEVDQKQFDKDLISELNLTLSKTRAENQAKLLAIQKKRYAMFQEQTMPAQLAEVKADLNQADSMLQLKQNQFKSLQVRAGSAGVLAQVREVIEPGQSVQPGTILAKITNPRQLKAQIRIPEAQAQDVQIGQPSEVDTYHGIVSGRVVRIDPTVIEGNVTVDVSLEGELPRGARPDLTVNGTIEIERLENVLSMRRPVFASENSSAELFKLVEDGEYAIRAPIKFGRSSVSTIEVVEGLSVGEEIILNDMSQWDEFDRIRLK
ncbi:MAG: HlyD family efflux transporter periplasmic adaptor subunit [Planctomycetes bacterium]|nr:HlyD family efflux transporter periplasmic adaptor subunit [Planctomycetota bacterium]